LYTLKDAAVYLGGSEWGVRELIWSRMIPVVMTPETRKIYVDILDLERFIDRNKGLYF
jgi:hypothetical protein